MFLIELSVFCEIFVVVNLDDRLFGVCFVVGVVDSVFFMKLVLKLRTFFGAFARGFLDESSEII